MRKRLFLTMLAVLAVTGCGKRAIVQKSAEFDGEEIRRGRTAYVVSAPINAKAVAPDLVASFEGKPEQGLDQLKGDLASGFAGKLNCPSGEFGTDKPLDGAMVPLGDQPRCDAALACLTIDKDELGIARASANDAATLRQLLADAGFDHLLILDQLALTRRMVERGDPVFGYAVGERAILGGQVYVWSNTANGFIYNGYVGGATPSTRVDKDDITKVACAFLRDLNKALR